MTTLAGRTAVVTGASRGIGAGIAAALTTQGARVVLVARNEARLKEQASKLKGSIVVICDITDPESVARAVTTITTGLGAAPDILVNSAGVFSVAPIHETSVETFVETVNTNLVGPFLFAHAFIAEMKARKSGHIVTIGSVADRTIFSGNAAYSAAKFGLRAVHEVMRAELRGTGVHTTLISPAATATEIWDTVNIADAGSRPAGKHAMLSPEDVVAAVLFALTQPDRVNIDELRLSRS